MFLQPVQNIFAHQLCVILATMIHSYINSIDDCSNLAHLLAVFWGSKSFPHRLRDGGAQRSHSGRRRSVSRSFNVCQIILAHLLAVFWGSKSFPHRVRDEGGQRSHYGRRCSDSRSFNKCEIILAHLLAVFWGSASSPHRFRD